LTFLLLTLDLVPTSGKMGKRSSATCSGKKTATGKRPRVHRHGIGFFLIGYAIAADHIAGLNFGDALQAPWTAEIATEFLG
jgi:hypothetical protein